MGAQNSAAWGIGGTPCCCVESSTGTIVDIPVDSEVSTASASKPASLESKNTNLARGVSSDSTNGLSEDSQLRRSRRISTISLSLSVSTLATIISEASVESHSLATIKRFGDGRVYQGDWSYGTMHGHGVMTWPNNQQYTGNFVMGKKEGYGNLEFVDGRSFCGPFEDDQPHGRGTIIGSSGEEYQCKMVKGQIVDEKYRRSSTRSNAESWTT